jgi:hypothetical protein
VEESERTNWSGMPPYGQPLAARNNLYPGEQRSGGGLAITALVVGGISLLLSWVPIINNGVFFTALAALLMGITASVLAHTGRAGGRAVAFSSIIVASMAMAGVLVSQYFYGEWLGAW